MCLPESGARGIRAWPRMRLMEACLAVLEREEAQEQPAPEPVYTPVVHALFRIPGALARMRATLAGLEAAMQLTAFLPPIPERTADRDLVVRSAVASTFFASLELARTAELVLGEGERFEDVTCTTSHDPQTPIV
jgi:hypothetical protein